MWRRLGERRELALHLAAFAQLLAGAGELERADSMARESVALAREGKISWDIGYCLTNAAAFVAQVRGELEEADRHLAEVEQIWSQERHPLGFPFVLNARALLALRRNDPSAAAHFARRALVETRDRRDLWFSSRSLRIIAYTSADDPRRAARLLGAADGMLQTITTGMLLHERGEHEQLLASLHVRLTPEVVESLLNEGRNLSFDDACALALDETVPSSTPLQASAEDRLLIIRDLGPLQISWSGKSLDLESRSSARARELLVFLAMHPAGATKEEAGVALWPDASTEQLKNSFHVTLHRLRKILGSSDVIDSEGGRYRLDAGSSHVITSRQFESELNRLLQERDSSSDALRKLDAVLSSYEGDYLQGEEFGEWIIPRRRHLRQLLLRGLFALGQLLEGKGRYDEAGDAYGRITAREPFHEAAWRQLMVCRARLGARSESLVLYRELEQRLRSELETTPEPETMTLFRRLQQNEAL
jgi:DNA-binding SARP family transcriptional activator